MRVHVYATVLEEILNNTWHRTVNGRTLSRLTQDMMDRFVRNLESDLKEKHATITERGDGWIRVRYRGRTILAEYDLEDDSWFAEVIR